MITSLLRILSIHFWAAGSTFLIETISLMLGIYLFWTSNTGNTRKKAWKKKNQAIFYISFQKGQLSHCVFSQNLSETKKNKNLVLFSGNKEGKFKSRSVSQALLWVFDFNKKHLCDPGFFLFHQIPTHKKETKHSKRCDAVNPEVDGKTRIGGPSLRKVLDRTLCWLKSVCCFFFCWLVSFDAASRQQSTNHHLSPVTYLQLAIESGNSQAFEMFRTCGKGRWCNKKSCHFWQEMPGTFLLFSLYTRTRTAK